MKKKRSIIIFSFLTIFIIVLIILSVLILNGKIILNNPQKLGYSIKGVDVSEYQGNIDWDMLSKQDIQFAFIKATEGSSYVDPYFEQNFSNAKDTNLRIGAYHFFSFESSGETQANNFINTVPIVENSLPNVIDVELYGDFKSNPLDVQSVNTELSTMIFKLEEHYGTKPIIYTTNKAYNLYIKNYFNDYSIWFRNVYTSNIQDVYNLDFWQYTNRDTLDGYNGDEKFIDMNVFCGSQEEFNSYYSDID